MMSTPRPATPGEMRLFAPTGLHTELGERWQMHRKLWEYLVVAMAGRMLEPKRALGFGVGREPIASWLASRGCAVTATDQPSGQGAEAWLSASRQYAGSLEALNERKLCPPNAFEQLVGYRQVDMREIPKDLRVGEFDFTWSCCAFEHLGSLGAGIEFFLDQMECLKPGGWAVHTTEFNLSSNHETLMSGDVVAYRKHDVEELIWALRHLGHHVADPAWAMLAETAPAGPPRGEHMTLRLDRYDVTSFLIAARKKE